jgi:hypothetical protein
MSQMISQEAEIARLKAINAELLEACKVMRSLISDELTMDTNHGTWVADRMRAFEMADAAILKAEADA